MDKKKVSLDMEIVLSANLAKSSLWNPFNFSKPKEKKL